MSKDNDSKKIDLILSEVRGVSASMTDLTRHVDRMDDRLNNVESDVSEMKADVKFIKNAVSEQSADIDDHEHRIKRLEKKVA